MGRLMLLKIPIRKHKSLESKRVRVKKKEKCGVARNRLRQLQDCRKINPPETNPSPRLTTSETHATNEGKMQLSNSLPLP